jgi:chromate transporter
MPEAPARSWKEIAASFLTVGATAYGGSAIMGIMQAEFQERRQWVTKPRFLEGLALVNVLAYRAFGVSPIIRDALYGLGPVVLAIFFAALFRLGKSALRSWRHGIVAVAVAALALAAPVGAASSPRLAPSRSGAG